MPPEGLTPRDGASIPPKRERLPDHEKQTMDEIERMTRDQDAALTGAIAAMNEIAANTAATEDAVLLLSDVKDLLVVALQHFGVPLPAHIAASMVPDADSGKAAYDPNNPAENEDEEDEDAEDGEFKAR